MTDVKDKREGCDVTTWPKDPINTSEGVSEVLAEGRICAVNGCVADVHGINDPNNNVFGVNAVTEGVEVPEPEVDEEELDTHTQGETRKNPLDTSGKD